MLRLCDKFKTTSYNQSVFSETSRFDSEAVLTDQNEHRKVMLRF